MAKTRHKRRLPSSAQRKRKRKQNRRPIVRQERETDREERISERPTLSLTVPTIKGKAQKVGVVKRRSTVKPRRIIAATSISRRDREILIVSRKGQPQIFTTVKGLERKSYPPLSVSSSWLSTIGYFFNAKIGTFTTRTGRQYKIINFDFKTFEEWFYALSKGTFFNDFIRDQYTIVGTL